MASDYGRHCLGGRNWYEGTRAADGTTAGKQIHINMEKSRAVAY